MVNADPTTLSVGRDAAPNLQVVGNLGATTITDALGGTWTIGGGIASLSVGHDFTGSVTTTAGDVGATLVTGNFTGSLNSGGALASLTVDQAFTTGTLITAGNKGRSPSPEIFPESSMSAGRSLRSASAAMPLSTPSWTGRAGPPSVSGADERAVERQRESDFAHHRAERQRECVRHRRQRPISIGGGFGPTAVPSRDRYARQRLSPAC